MDGAKQKKGSKLDIALNYLRTDGAIKVVHEIGARDWSPRDKEINIGIVPRMEPDGIAGLGAFEKALVSSMRKLGLRVTENYSHYRSNGDLDLGVFYVSSVIGERITRLHIKDETVIKILRAETNKIIERSDIELHLGVHIYPTMRIFKDWKRGKVESMKYAPYLSIDEMKRYLPTYFKDSEFRAALGEENTSALEHEMLSNNGKITATP